MDFDLTETQQLFKRSARDFFAQECPPARVREMIEAASPYSEELWSKLVEQGWTGLIYPEEMGGLGLGMVEMVLAFEEMGRALAPGAFLSTVALAGPIINSACSTDYRDKLISAICEGKLRATVALLEEGTGWDPEGVGLQAAESDGQIRLNGKKLFVSDAGASDLIITAARLGSGIALAFVKSDAEGLTIKPMAGLDGTRMLYEVQYENVLVGPDDVIADDTTARLALRHALDVGALAVSAEMVGGMQWVLDATVEYAKTRKQFGKPIGQFQAIQHHCANMLMMTESARSAVYYAAWVMGNDPGQAPLAVSMAKTYASDAYREVGNLGIQAHGGIGFTWDENIHFYYRRAKASELLFGDATYHRERIAKLIVDGATEPVKAASQTGD
jgi:alkylation response protein AidB-like acyl-CoA dehydrogenase